MSATDTVPATQEILSVETLALVADMSAELVSNETISTAATELIDLQSGAPYPGGLVGLPSISGGKLLTQVVSALQPGRRYRLIWIATVASNKIVGARTTLSCPA